MPDYVEYIKNGAGDVPKQIRDPEALRRTGDTMTGALDMANFKITNLGAPENDADAVHKSYVDEAISDSAFTGDMGGKNITNLGTPAADTDAAHKKYVDDAIPKWTLLNVLTTDNASYTFTESYSELEFIYDPTGNVDGHIAFDGAVPMVIPTVCLSETAGYFGMQYSSNVRFTVKVSNTSAEVYAATWGGYSNDDYKVYIFGR